MTAMSVRDKIEAVGDQLLFLPSYSSDLNPIEMSFVKLKALLRKAAERGVEGLWSVTARILETFACEELRNYSDSAWYNTDS